MSMRVVARIPAQPDQVDQVREILAGLVEPTRREAGCIAYDLLQNKTDPAEFTFVEEWESDEALDAHLKTHHVQAALARLQGLLAAEPDIRRYTQLG